MKVTIDGHEPEGFKPITVTVTLETQAELDDFTQAVSYLGEPRYTNIYGRKETNRPMTALLAALKRAGGITH